VRACVPHLRHPFCDCRGKETTTKTCRLSQQQQQLPLPNGRRNLWYADAWTSTSSHHVNHSTADDDVSMRRPSEGAVVAVTLENLLLRQRDCEYDLTTF
jgi:hypothetical protein